MVSIEEADCDALQFNWVDYFSKDSPKLNVYLFTWVMFGISSSPFLLNATIRFHLEKFLETNEGLVHQLLCSMYMYVDDILTGGQTEREVFSL